MGFDTATGVYTPPSGAIDASPGDVIRSATWNSINAGEATALTQLAQQAYVNGPRLVTSAGNITVAATDNLIFISASVPTIVMGLAAVKSGPVKIFGAASTVFGSVNSKVIFTGGETCSGLSTITLDTNWQVITMYPRTGGYLLDG